MNQFCQKFRGALACFAKNEQGSAMVIVLVMVTTITLLVGVVLLGEVLSNRLIHQNYSELQAFYAAEAGLQKAMWYLAGNKGRDVTWRTEGEQLELFKNLDDGVLQATSAIVHVCDWGGYIKITSTATHNGKQESVAAMIGQRMTPECHNAVTIGKSEYALVATGNTKIYGNVLVGKQGVRTEWIKGKPYTGGTPVSGEIVKQEKPVMPAFNSILFQKAFMTYKNRTQSPQGLQIFENTRFRDTKDITSNTIYVHGDVEIDLSDKDVLEGRRCIVAQDDLIISGRTKIRSDVELIAGGKVFVKDRVEIGRCILYGALGVEVSREAEMKAQIFSPVYIEFSERAQLRYPGLVFCTADASDKSQPTGIFVKDRAIVQGCLIAASFGTDSLGQKNAVKIDVVETTEVEGIMYSTGVVNLQGSLHGSVITSEFELYMTPTRYQNYLYNAHIDRRDFPNEFLLPIQFGAVPQLEILSREPSNLAKTKTVKYVAR